MGRAFLRPFLVARWSKRPNTDFGRTTVKTTIYSHDGQNDLIVIFDHRASKMGEIFRRDNFKTTGVMFRCKILSPEQRNWKFDPFDRTSSCDCRFWSRDGRNDRIVIFDRRATKMGEIFRRDNFETTGVMFRYEIISPEQSNWKFDPFQRTLNCDPKFWSHDGRNDRIVIFDPGVAKMGEIFRRDNFETTGVMFQCKIISPEQKFCSET